MLLWRGLQKKIGEMNILWNLDFFAACPDSFFLNIDKFVFIKKVLSVELTEFH